MTSLKKRKFSHGESIRLLEDLGHNFGPYEQNSEHNKRVRAEHAYLSNNPDSTLNPLIPVRKIRTASYRVPRKQYIGNRLSSLRRSNKKGIESIFPKLQKDTSHLVLSFLDKDYKPKGGTRRKSKYFMKPKP